MSGRSELDPSEYQVGFVEGYAAGLKAQRAIINKALMRGPEKSEQSRIVDDAVEAHERAGKPEDEASNPK